MTRILLLTIAVLATGSLRAQPTPALAGDRATTPAATVPGAWIESYQAGLARARAEKKPVLIDFRADWCGPCRMMEQETFTDPAVRVLLGRFVLVRVDVDREQQAALTWHVSAIPRLIMLNVHGQVIGDQLGFMTPDQFAPLVEEALRHADEILPDAPPVPALPTEERLTALERGLAAADDAALTSAVAQLAALPKSADRREGLTMLARHPDKARAALLKLLGDERLAVRVTALEGLKTLGVATPVYDPWAASAARRVALERLTAAP